MPDGYEYPKISVSDYLEIVKRLLKQWEKNKEGPFSSTGFLGQKMSREEIYVWVENKVLTEGIHVGTPFYIQVITPRAQAVWPEQYKEKLAEWAEESAKYQQQQIELQESTRRWREEQAFGREKFEWQKEQEGKLTPWQQQQLQQQSWETLNQADIARWTRDAEIANLNVRRMEAQLSGVGGEAGWIPEQKKQAQLSQEFENIRSQMIQNLSPSPRNWIAIEKARMMENPYGARERNPQEELLKAQEEYKDAKEMWALGKQIQSEASKDPMRSLDQREKQMIELSKVALDNAAKQLHRARLTEGVVMGKEWAKSLLSEQPREVQEEIEQEAYWATPRGDVATGFEVGRPSGGTKPTMPEIPAWLQQASGLKGRVPETRKPILTPSGQSWTALSPTQQSMYAGLVDWVGQRSFEDIDWQRRQMLPKAPSLGRTWKPAQARV